MKLARLTNTPSALADFFSEGLGVLGAVCERTWHDRLQVLAEGAAATLWNPDGSLLETEIQFVSPDDTAPRRADREVFPGCPLTFRLTEALRPRPLGFERGVLQPDETMRPPTTEVAEKLWHAQMPGTSRWRIVGTLLRGWHFSLLALARCEIQAIDQHWTLHRLAISLPDGAPDETLAGSLDFLQLAPPPSALPWPKLDLSRWRDRLKAAFQQELQTDLGQIRQRQQRYLQRELERIDAYFEAYEREISSRQRRSQEGARIKAEERLAAARVEHARRRQDQIHRHEIRVIPHLDALLLLAEPAWLTEVSYLQQSENKVVPAQLVPRSRRWVVQSASAEERRF